MHDLALAEDVVQDAFCRAVEVWKVRGVPDNPAAWLMATAKHRALDIVRRERTARTFAPEIRRLLESEWTLGAVVDEAFEAPTIRDEQLRMMFSCCDPRLPEEAQIALILNVLCGFGPAEVASAFLVSTAAVEKRIARGKQALAASKRLFDLQDEALTSRLTVVHRALYLLFNEGYHGVRAEPRTELCDEALRMTVSLLEHAASATPTTFALASLMCLHGARLPARIDAAGDLSTLAEQDRSLWDGALIADGLAFLERSASGEGVSVYHIEAAIAATHTGARSLEDTDWDVIVSLYDRLLATAPSPVTELARAIALGERDGPVRGLEALRAIEAGDRLARYPYYPAAIAELERRRGNHDTARALFHDAISLARNEVERRFLTRRLALCTGS